MRKIRTPLTEEMRTKLRCGEEILLSGTLYTARDQAHKKLIQLILGRKELPFDIENSVLYYAGPTPIRGNEGFGSCGPTTSARMDEFTPALLRKGVAAMIGKGRRSLDVKQSIKKHKAVYFLTVGGAGAYLAKKIKSMVVIAFEELGPEAIYKLEVEDFPLVIGIDSKGNDIYPN